MTKSANTAPAPEATGLLAVYLQNNKVSAKDLPGVIAAFGGSAAASAPAAASAAPAPAKAPVKAAKRTKVKAKKAKKAKAKTVKAVAVKAKKAAKPVAKAQNQGAILIEMAVPTRSIKGAKAPASSRRRKFLGIRQVNDPAVAISEVLNLSADTDFLTCLEDGKKFKMMKRWLRATYGMSPEDYRAKWGLPADYPMVAPGYAREKSDYAKFQGLGTNENKNHGKTSIKDLNKAVVAGSQA